MNPQRSAETAAQFSVVLAEGETPIFRPGDRARVIERFPIGHSRVPLYLRGKTNAGRPPSPSFSSQKRVLTPTGLAEKMKEVEGRWPSEPVPATTSMGH